MKDIHRSRLVLFDLDGTALESTEGAVLSQRLKDAIAASGSDIRIAIATGRSWEHFWYVIADIAPYLDHCIISGGSQIVDCQSREIIWQVSMSSTQIEALNAIATRYNKPLSFNSGVRTITREPQIDGVQPTIVYLLDIHPSELNEIYVATSQIAGLHVAITHAWGDTGGFVLHITHEHANKGTATRELLRRLRIAKQHATAIGDGLNDLPMFEVVGTPLAVAGSEIDGHVLAIGTVERLIDDGVAAHIEMLNRQRSLL